MLEQDKVPLAQQREVFDAISDMEQQTPACSPSQEKQQPILDIQENSQTKVDDDETPLWVRILLQKPTNLSWCLIMVAVLGIPLALLVTVYREVSIQGVPASGLLAWLETVSGTFWIVRMFVDNLQDMSDGTGQNYNKGFRESNRKATGMDTIKFPYPAEQKLTIVTQRRMAWSIFFTVLSATITSSTPLLCYSDHSGCNATWIYNLRKAVRATCVVAAVWFIKSLLVELMIIRSRIRFHKARQRKIDQAQQFIGIALCGFCDKLKIDDDPLLTKPDEAVGTEIRRLFVTARYERFWLPFFQYIKKSMQVEAYVRDEALADADLETIFRDEFCRRLHLNQHQLRGLSITKCNVQNKLTKENLLNASKEEFWAFLDLDKNGKITFNECVRMWSSEIVPYERGLENGTDGIRNAAKGVNRVASTIVLVAAVFVYAAFFSTDFSTWATPLWTCFTGIGFAIGGVATEFFNSCGFVFAKQPYDVGDHVCVGSEKDLIVEDVHLTYTVFSRMNDGIKLQISHQDLDKTWICNYSRTCESERQFKQVVPIKTKLTDDDCEKLSQELTSYIEASMQHCRHIQKVTLSCALAPEADGKGYMITMDVEFSSGQLVRDEKNLASSLQCVWKQLRENLKKREH